MTNHRIALDESEYRPHLRVIRTLLQGGTPSISIRDSIEVVAACEAANNMAIDCGSYEARRVAAETAWSRMGKDGASALASACSCVRKA